MGFRGAAPVTQGPNVSASQRLLEAYPIDYLTSGNFSDVPLMIGTNKHEGSFVLTSKRLGSGFTRAGLPLRVGLWKGV